MVIISALYTLMYFLKDERKKAEHKYIYRLSGILLSYHFFWFSSFASVDLS